MKTRYILSASTEWYDNHFLDTYRGWGLYHNRDCARRFASRSEAKRAKKRCEAMGWTDV